VTVNYPPKSGTYTGNADYVQVKIKSAIQTSFLHLFGQNSLANEVESVVLATGHAPFLGDDLIWSANPHECSGLTINGSTITHLSNGNAYVASDCSSGKNALNTNGEALDYTVENGNTYVVGTVDPKANLDPAAVTGVDYKPYPYVSMPDCDPIYKNTTPKTTNPMIPGKYAGAKFTGGTNVTFLPGLYCFTDDVSMTGGGTISGTGVLFVFYNPGNAHGKSNKGKGSTCPVFNIGGNSSLNGADGAIFSAPLSPFNLLNVDGSTVDYAGLLFYEDPSCPTNSKPFKITGDNVSSLTGAIYLPTQDCTLIGNNGTTSVNTQLLCNTINLEGNGTVSMSLTSDNPFEYGGDIKLMQ
jgi:hypothetical protein